MRTAIILLISPWVVSCAHSPTRASDSRAPERVSAPAPVNSSAEIPLFRKFPALAHELPRSAIVEGPTPVERLGRVERELRIAHVYVKRDDLTARPYGGGKPRKLEWLLGAALARRHPAVVTIGAVASHHALATAIYGRRAGLDVILLLLPQPKSDEARAALLAEAEAGAELHLVGSQRAAEQLEKQLERLPPEGRNAFVVPTGGTSPLGDVGYVNAAFELDEQIARGELTEPDFIYVPLGTMGTAVGLAVGLRACGRASRVVAVRVSSPSTSSIERLRQEFDATVRFLTAADPSFPAVRFADAGIDVVGDQLGGGYGIPTRAGQSAIVAARRWTGLELEPTYTAKAFAALVADAPHLADRTVLYWYTDAAAVAASEDAAAKVPESLRGYLAP
jgi:D-cysteine desulfhydrase